MSFIKRILLPAGLAFFLIADINCKADKQNTAIITGYVVSVADGDTFTLLTEEKKQVKIRLYGIDCPERKQPFGQAAKQKLSDHIFNKNVLAKKTDVDRYGRTVAIVYDESNNCINEQLLQDGLAWHYLKYDTNVYWEQLQNKAKEKKIGLWTDKNAVAPWEWRIKNK